MSSYNPSDPNPNNPANISNQKPKGPRAGVNPPGPRGPKPQKNRQGEGQQVRLTGQTAEEIARSIEQAVETKLNNAEVDEKAERLRGSFASPNAQFAAGQSEARAAMAAAANAHKKDEIQMDAAASLMGEAISNSSKEKEDTMYISKKPIQKPDVKTEFGMEGSNGVRKTKGKPLTNEGPDVKPHKVLRPEETPDKPNTAILGTDNHTNGTEVKQEETTTTLTTAAQNEESIQTPGAPDVPDYIPEYEDGMFDDIADQGLFMDNYDAAYAMLYEDDMMQPMPNEDIRDIRNNDNIKKEPLVMDASALPKDVKSAYNSANQSLSQFSKSDRANDKKALTDLISNIDKAYSAQMNKYYMQQLYFNPSKMSKMERLGYMLSSAVMTGVAMGLKSINEQTPKEAFEIEPNAGKFTISSYDFDDPTNMKHINASDFDKYLQQHRDDIMTHVGEQLGISDEDMKKNHIYITDGVSDETNRVKQCQVAFTGFDGIDPRKVDAAIRSSVSDVLSEYGDPNVIMHCDTYALSTMEKAYCKDNYSVVHEGAVRTYGEKLNVHDHTASTYSKEPIQLDSGLSAGFDAAQERMNDGHDMSLC